jgi:hypothetical protein
MLGLWLVIVEENPALLDAGTQPRVSRRIRLRIAVAPYRFHSDPMTEGARVHSAKGSVEEREKLVVIQRARPVMCKMMSCDSPRMDSPVIPASRVRCSARIIPPDFRSVVNLLRQEFRFLY